MDGFELYQKGHFLLMAKDPELFQKFLQQEKFFGIEGLDPTEDYWCLCIEIAQGKEINNGGV